MAVGIKDVARVAGVSAATVSRVLAGKAVDAAMQARVLDAVKTTGYRPNLAARRLRSRHSNVIGLIVADIRNPFFTAVSRSVETVAAARGMQVILCNTDEDPAKEAMYLDLMHQERAAGVILAPSRPRVARMDRPESGRSESGGADSGRAGGERPMVLIDRAIPGAPCDCVLLDNERMAGLLVEHLHARGHRRIAGLFGAQSMTGHERRAGFERAAAALGLEAQSLAVPHCAPGSDRGEADRALAALLTGPQRPDALVASNGVMLLHVLRALRAQGLSVPADIALAGFDNNDWMDFVGHGTGISVIEQPVEEIGRTATTMLLDRLDNPEAPTRKVVLAGKLVARD